MGIKRGSSLKDVKRSFRRKAKQLHPDLRQADRDYLRDGNGADEKMRVILKAYEVLSNPRKKREYDSLLSYAKTNYRYSFNYREFLKERRDDLFSQAKLIFYDLLNSHPLDALSLYEYLCSHRSFRLERYLDREDYMDCTFLLAEQLAERGDYVKAIELFKKIYLDELERPYFKHFVEEIILRMKEIACFRLTTMGAPDQGLRYLKDLLALDFSRKDKALFYKKMAELYWDMGNNALAVESLRLGLKLNKRLPGIKKLKEKIGYKEIHVSP